MSHGDGFKERSDPGSDQAELVADAEVEILSIEGASELGEAEQSPPSVLTGNFTAVTARSGVEASEASTAPDASRLQELEERYLRLLADFDNFRKRSDREREEARRHGLTAALRELLPVLDNLERALASAVEGSDSGELVRGVELILRQLADSLRRLGVSPVPGVGTRFNPELHEAVAQEDSDGVREVTVVAEFQRGYWLGDRLLRPALVRVAVPAGDSAHQQRDSGRSGSAGEMPKPARGGEEL